MSTNLMLVIDMDQHEQRGRTRCFLEEREEMDEFDGMRNPALVSKSLRPQYCGSVLRARPGDIKDEFEQSK